MKTIYIRIFNYLIKYPRIKKMEIWNKKINPFNLIH